MTAIASLDSPEMLGDFAALGLDLRAVVVKARLRPGAEMKRTDTCPEFLISTFIGDTRSALQIELGTITAARTSPQSSQLIQEAFRRSLELSVFAANPYPLDLIRSSVPETPFEWVPPKSSRAVNGIVAGKDDYLPSDLGGFP